MIERYKSTKAVAVTVVLAMALLAGCAVQNTLGPKVQQVEQGIGTAKNLNAEIYAPDALKSAEERLSFALSAIAAEDYVKASRLLDEALADAELASIKAPSEKTKGEVTVLQDGITTLKAEISRMTTPK